FNHTANITVPSTASRTSHFYLLKAHRVHRTTINIHITLLSTRQHSSTMPATPNKRKAADAQHAARAAVQPSPFKQRKLDSELSVEITRCAENDRASNRPMSSKLYDPYSIRTVPGGFEISYKSTGSHGFKRIPSPLTMVVPSTLAHYIREQVLNAATSRSNKLGKTSTERMQGRFREIMKEYADIDVPNLLNMTDKDEQNILFSKATSNTYTSLASAFRGFPALLDNATIWAGKAAWDPQASTLETKADGRITVIFKSHSGLAVMKVSFKEIYYV
ncbi:hypothetical protein BJ166DRAFT_607073, partial [Pestalotiopsis sp. NC0098]